MLKSEKVKWKKATYVLVIIHIVTFFLQICLIYLIYYSMLPEHRNILTQITLKGLVSGFE